MYGPTDIDECLTNNGGCAQNCTNTIGSYYCSCNKSYVLGSDGHACNGKEWEGLVINWN